MKQKLHPLMMEEAEWVVKQFDACVRKQLSRVNVSPKDNEYEDLLQEGRILLVKTASEYEVNWQDEVDVGRYMSLVGKRIRWCCIDYFRQSYVNREQAHEERDFYDLFDESIDIQYDMEQYVLMDEIRSILTIEEWELLKALMDESRSRTQIAKDFGLTRKSLYTKRHQIQRKLKKVMNHWHK